MKTLFTLISAIVISTVSMAQITITDGDFPGIGTLLYQGVDTVLPAGLDLGSASATAQTWDFTILQTDSLFQFGFHDPGEVAHGDSFPTADVAVDQFGGNGFVDVNSAGADIIGFGGSFQGFNIDIAAEFQDPYTIVSFPSTFGTSFNDTAILDVTLYNDGFVPSFPPLFDPDSIRFKRTSDLSGTIDAFGTATDALGDPHDVLRQIFVEESIDSLWYYQNGQWQMIPSLLFENPILDTTRNMRFLSGSLGYMVADFRLDENMNPTEATFLSDTSLFGVGVEEMARAERDLIYPNPTNGIVSFKNVEDNSIFELIDLSGKLVFSQPVNANQRLDVSATPPGLYIFRLQDGDGSIKVGRLSLID